ncbi:MAG TPA: hypothetical protein VFS83_02570 [Ktedonobacterales bacterium]|nr:hypothetical protein [Ktedonobacterales bacterium]
MATDDAFPARVVPVMTPAAAPGVAPELRGAMDADGHMRIARAGAPSGLESATKYARAESPVQAEQEATTMEGSVSPTNPAQPGVTPETIHDENQIAELLDESQHAYTRTATHPASPEMIQRQPTTSPGARTPPPTDGGRLSWLPGVALAALIVGIAAWTVSRSIRRGRKRAAKAAKAARASVRSSVSDARKSAVTLAQTMRASAKEVAANPRDTATDAFSNLSDVQARYRWFRRGIRVGAKTARFQKK